MTSRRANKPRHELIAVIAIAIASGATIGLSGWCEGIGATLVKSTPMNNLTVFGVGTDLHKLGSVNKLGNRTLDQIITHASHFDDIAFADKTAMISPEYTAQLAYRRPTGISINSETVRGVDPIAFQVHPGIQILRGSAPKLGEKGILIGEQLLGQYEGFVEGGKIPIGRQLWPIIGVLHAPGTIFESELWGDRSALMQEIENVHGASHFETGGASMVILRLLHAESASRLGTALQGVKDQRLEVLPERFYYTRYEPGPVSYDRLFVPMTFAALCLWLGAAMTLASAMDQRLLRRPTPSSAARHLRTAKSSLILAIAGVALGLTGSLPWLGHRFEYRCNNSVCYFLPSLTLSLVPMLLIGCLILASTGALVSLLQRDRRQ